MNNFDLIIIGAGPGGITTAIRASQLGEKVAIIEKAAPGGTCLNVGCIPSKALIDQTKKFSNIQALEEMGLKIDQSDFDYKNVFQKSRDAVNNLYQVAGGLIQKNQLMFIQGEAKLTSTPNMVKVGDIEYKAKNIVIATGAQPKEIKGFEFDGKQVLSSNDAIMSPTLPKSVIIIGSGAIGMEFAYIWGTFGSQVTVVEALPNILPSEDRTTVNVLCESLEKKGIKLLTNTKALSLKKEEKGIELTVEKEGKQEVLKAEKILIAVGRTPNTQGLGLEEAGIKVNKNGFIEVGDYYQTSIANVYAIGDVAGTKLLTHVAAKEGEIVAEHIKGHKTIKRVDPLNVPQAIFTQPEIASFGYTEEEAKNKGVSFKCAVFPYKYSCKAVAISKGDGLVKIIFDEKTHEILGAHIVGENASETLHELVVAKEANFLPKDLAKTIHIHPTISETVMEAAQAVEGWAIHLI